MYVSSTIVDKIESISGHNIIRVIIFSTGDISTDALNLERAQRNPQKD